PGSRRLLRALLNRGLPDITVLFAGHQHAVCSAEILAESASHVNSLRPSVRTADFKLSHYRVPAAGRAARAWTPVLDENRGAEATTFEQLIDTLPDGVVVT